MIKPKGGSTSSFVGPYKFPREGGDSFRKFTYGGCSKHVWIYFSLSLYTDPIELVHWSPYWKAFKWGMFLYFAGDISLLCPYYEVKELPRPICEPGWQLCDCGKHRVEHQLASPIGYLWIWDMPSTMFRHGVFADSKHGQIKPMSACRIPQSSISFITPFTIWLPVWLQLVLFSPAYQLSPVIRCSQ